MTQAMRLARQGLYTTKPNPRVGCVIVNQGVVVGSGWHEKSGADHAEIVALKAAGDRARGATCYVTLEPCCHQGRTGPCDRALIEAGVKRVVIAMEDPNPQVFGQGIAQLKAADIDVQLGLMREQALQLNKGFVSRMQRQRPYVVCKLAMSLDGRTAMANGESKWITSSAARLDVQRLRAQCGAIITGCGTVLSDDPTMQVRWRELAEIGELYLPLSAYSQPLRVVLDSGLTTSPQAIVYGPPGATMVVTASTAAEARVAFENRGIAVEVCANESGRIDLDKMLAYLVQRQINEVLVEAGSTLCGAFLKANLIDELIIYMAPKLMGSTAQPLVDLPLLNMADALELKIKEIRAVGDDWRITATPNIKAS
ncbi:MAG: bifunctional diaminohydroxyphosphoribosylaminopyrimidine deaminase/5-amino-6-(5-phosphoribosylamino)uracil reductase RibD [Gammaproteobacteria bacterium]|nr:bifunctional diaminohydroxyphosphoribosylaminopyrimidine deaminase/5-amino-6-(5-phosphoribosylamino)uracil reductase RibD [Gammaproteobacteria bacterium]